MKHGIGRIGIVISALLLCAQFSSQQSSLGTPEKPAINISGTLITDGVDGNPHEVENITISGRYENIPVYEKPSSEDVNPDINTTRLDLRQISEIRPVSVEILKFNNRDYVEIEIVSNDAKKTKNTYIIERVKRVQCDEVNAAGPIEKEVSFLAIKNLIIKGSRPRQEAICEHMQYAEKNIVLDSTITQTKNLVNQLEDTTKQLHADDPKESAIKSQLLHLIHEVKQALKSWFA